jgi:hypothetical protein
MAAVCSHGLMRVRTAKDSLNAVSLSKRAYLTPLRCACSNTIAECNLGAKCAPILKLAIYCIGITQTVVATCHAILFVQSGLCLLSLVSSGCVWLGRSPMAAVVQ